MSMRTTLVDATRILQVHPRTILRAISRKINPYWVEGHDQTLDTSDLARGFKTKALMMEALFLDNEPLLKPAQACEVLKMHPRTFRAHNYTPVVRKDHVVRFSREKLLAEHKERLELKSIL